MSDGWGIVRPARDEAEMALIDKINDVAGLPEIQIHRLKERYKSPVRHYHTFDHAIDVASQALRYPAWGDRRAAIIAALYHDAIYAPGELDNEFLSAWFMFKELKYHVDHATLYRAERFIVLTAHHFKVSRSEISEPDCAFLDCDIAGLAAPWDVFAAQCRAIDKEFMPLAGDQDSLFRARRKFIENVLGLDRIFLSKPGFQLYEDDARVNLNCALAELYPER